MARALPIARLLGVTPFYLDRNCPDTFAHGVASRFARPMPEPDEAELRAFEANTQAWLDANLSPLEDLPDFDDWLDGTPYTQSRKSELADERRRFAGEFPDEAECHVVKSFMKTEPYLKPKAARPINSRTDLFKVFFGPIVHSIEKKLFNARDHDTGNNIFVKYIPVPFRPLLIAALRKMGFYYYSTDYPSFEASFTRRLMQATSFLLYRHMLKKFPTHWRFIEAVLGGKNRIRSKLFQLVVEALRMSGEMDTSCANGFSNAMVFNHLLVSRGIHGSYVVEGDDGLLAVGRKLTSEDLLVVEKLGFLLKITEEDDPCEASFCGLIFADQGVVKDPVRTFVNIGWTNSFIYGGFRVMLSLARAKGLALAYETGSCPLNWALATAMLKTTRGVKITHRPDSYNQIPSDEATCLERIQAPTLATRLLYERKFGLSIREQLEAEHYILNTDLWQGLDPKALHIDHLLDPALVSMSHCSYG
jgi:hypothetical protein